MIMLSDLCAKFKSKLMWILALIVFFLPEILILSSWLVFGMSLIDIRDVMMDSSVEGASFRLVICSAIVLMVIQIFRIFPLRKENMGRQSIKFWFGNVLIIFFILLGLASQMKDVRNLLNGSCIDIVFSFVVVAGAVYLITDLLVLWVVQAMTWFKGE